LYDRYSKLEARNLGATTAIFVDKEGDVDKELEAVSKIAIAKAKQFTRSLSGASQVL